MVGAFLQEPLHLGLQFREVEVKMLGLAQLERATLLGTRIDLFLRLEHIPAVVTLIGARAFVAADVTGPFHVAVGKESFRRWGVPLQRFLGEEKTVFLQRQKHRLRYLEMILGVGGGK